MSARGLCILMGGPDRVIIVRGRPMRFEMHPWCGPVVIGKGGDPVAQPPERHPFWHAVTLWAQHGQRVGVDGVCVWDRRA